MPQESLHSIIIKCINDYKILIDQLCKHLDEEMRNPTSSSVNVIFQRNLYEIYAIELKLNSVLTDGILYYIFSILMLLVEKHQIINGNINRLQNDCESMKQSQQKITESLFLKIDNFSLLLEHGKSLLSVKDNDSTSEPIDVNELLLYSSRVARHTLSVLTPPIPQDDQMRSSKLFSIGDKLNRNGENLHEISKSIPEKSKDTVKIDLDVDVTKSSGAQDGPGAENDAEELLDLF